MFENRRLKIRDSLVKQGLDAFYVSNLENIYYLTGFRGVSPEDRESSVLITPEKVFLFVAKMYAQEAERILEDGLEIVVGNGSKSLYDLPLSYVEEKSKLGFESFNLRHIEYEYIKSKDIELLPYKKFVEDLRIIKDGNEIELIRKAVEITDKTFSFVSNIELTDLSEKELGLLIYEKFLELGAEDKAFETIVASGINSSLPHYKTSDIKVDKGILLIDMGAKYEGYCADMTRTLYLGDPDDRFHETYDKVLEVNEKVIGSLRPGVTCNELWSIADNTFNSHSQYFVHSLGHGVGLNIHERPALSFGDDFKLKPGMVITVEPGLYYPDWGGVRIEDLCLVTEEGCDVLSTSKK